MAGMSRTKIQNKTDASVSDALSMAQLSATALLDALPDAVLLVSTDGIIRFANHAALSFTGIGQKNICGKTLALLLGDTHPAVQALDTVIRHHQQLTLNDLSILGKAVNACSLTPMEDMPMVLVTWRHDVIALRDAWLDKIRQSIKPAQHLTRMLAHEVRNPLAGIRGAAQLLQKGDLAEDDRALAKLIEDETQRISRLVDKVNVFDGVPQSEFAAINIHAVSDHVIGLVRAGICADIAVETRYDPSLPDILGHQDSLIQAVLNLVKNAAEAGATVIALRSYYDTAAGFHPDSGLRLPVTLEITDNGQGMDDKTIARLFEPCFTTKPDGEGLGLAIVSQIVDDHGGAMQVQSVPGATTFRIRLPLPQRRKLVKTREA